MTKLKIVPNKIQWDVRNEIRRAGNRKKYTLTFSEGVTTKMKCFKKSAQYLKVLVIMDKF